MLIARFISLIRSSFCAVRVHYVPYLPFPIVIAEHPATLRRVNRWVGGMIATGLFFLANSKYSLSRAIFMLLTFRMRDFIVLIVHLASTIFRIGRPGGVRSVIAESVLMKHQLPILNRCRRRAPNLRVWDRVVSGLCSLLLQPKRVTRAAIALKPSTLLNFHRALVRRKFVECRSHAMRIRRTTNILGTGRHGPVHAPDHWIWNSGRSGRWYGALSDVQAGDSRCNKPSQISQFGCWMKADIPLAAAPRLT